MGTRRRLPPKPSPRHVLLGRGTDEVRWSRRSVAERDALVVQWQYLPRFVVGKMDDMLIIRKLSVEDAVSVGYLALIRAAEMWDETFRTAKGRPVLFKTYAVTSIKRRILHAANGNGLIHTPASGRTVHNEDYERARMVDTLDTTPAGEWRDSSTQGALLFDSRRDGSVRDVESRDQLARCNELLRFLTARRRTALRLRFYEGLTYREIARRMRVSNQRANQLCREAIDDLQKRLGVGADG